MEMNLVADSSYGSSMQAAQQQLFFKEASDASYRAKGNLTPEQQVRARCPEFCCACPKCVAKRDSSVGCIFLLVFKYGTWFDTRIIICCNSKHSYYYGGP